MSQSQHVETLKTKLAAGKEGELVDPRYPVTRPEEFDFLTQLNAVALKLHFSQQGVVCAETRVSIFGKGYQGNLGDPYKVKGNCVSCGKVFTATAPMVIWE